MRRSASMYAKVPKASGHATPMTFQGKNKKQYVVIAAGGGNKYNESFSDELIAYEADLSQRSTEAKIDETQFRVDYNRRPETDMEVCMPRHTLEIFAEGRGIWSGLPPAIRRAQLIHMADLIDELYPAFRLYLYDGRMRYSIPYTIFGPFRAAIYVGDMYLVLNATAPIRTLPRHFDNLIRAADINAHETASFARQLASGNAIDRT